LGKIRTFGFCFIQLYAFNHVDAKKIINIWFFALLRM
jgi:hypothetical protein